MPKVTTTVGLSVGWIHDAEPVAHVPGRRRDRLGARAAAQELVVTQAAVSASLAALQRSLGVALLDPGRARAAADRRGPGLRGLRPAGPRPARRGRAGRRCRRRPGARRAADRGRHDRGRADRARAARAASGRHPAAGVRLEAGNRERVHALLDRHQVDLVLGGRPEPGWDVPLRPSGRTELVVVAAPDWPPTAAPAGQAAGRAAGLLPWLARQAWLLREPGSGTRAATDALLAELDIAPPTLMVGSNGAIRESASVGLGVTLISRDAVAAELADGRARRARRAGHAAAPRLVPGRAPAAPLPPACASAAASHVLSHGGFRPANSR